MGFQLPLYIETPIVGDSIIYNFGWHLWSGQTASYRAGDEGTMYSDGFFDYNPTIGQNSLFQQLVNRDTLLYNNIHGNTNRFTNRTGGTPTNSGNRFLRDHYTGIEYYLQAYNVGQNWDAAIDAGVAINTTLSETGWYLPPSNVFHSLNDSTIASVWLINPINMIATRNTWTSTTQGNSTSNAKVIITNTGSIGAGTAKTTTTNMLRGMWCKRFI
jgi:hypothetical protein